MEMLRGAYERDRKNKIAKAYTFVRKQKIGNVERNVFVKEIKHYGKHVNGSYKSPFSEKVEYVKYNGKYMKLKNYKELMKSKNLYKSPSPQKLSSPRKSCKKDCSLIKKVCNNKTGRCNKPKVLKLKK
jgi:hypothetical protein